MIQAAPFPWFGGKRRVANVVWQALGDVDNYVEPFFGSGATLLCRPVSHRRRVETVNDADAYLANFWRALAADPDEVAYHADWPVNECDLMARHLWLVNAGRERIGRMEADPEFYDAKVAGWWVWGICSWIGGGWCSGAGPWVLDDAGGVGKRPHLSNAGQGVNRKRPHLGNSGQGVNRGSHKPGRETRPDALVAYFRALADRLRGVRVCCGDWARVCTDGAMAFGNSVGVFLDPPYSGDVRARDLYRVDDHSLSVQVRDWAVAHGDDPRMRIVLAGYEPEHEAHIPPTWRRYAYAANASYQRYKTSKTSGNAINRKLERLWFSPHCDKRSVSLATLFEEGRS